MPGTALTRPATSKQREEFIAKLARVYPDIPVDKVAHFGRLLMRFSATYKRNRMIVRANHGKFSTAELAYYQVRASKLEKRITDISKEFPWCHAMFSNDVDSATVVLKLPLNASVIVPNS